MKAFFNCELHYFKSPHLSQIYDGFYKLSKSGIINLTIKASKGDTTKPLLKVILDNKITIIYDTLDGLNWINDSVENNLLFFKNNYKCDFYFKRSYKESILKYAPKNCHLYPLGLNYNVYSNDNFSSSIKDITMDLIKKNPIFTYISNKRNFSSKYFEHYPVLNKKTKVLFLTRLWNPNDVELDHLKTERELINTNRISCIKACNKKFGSSFLGGIQRDSYSLKIAKELIMPDSITNKEKFIYNVKRHDICIATTGLHDSIGWKFGEYVAASRAIISEPLNYELPGNFDIYKNYFKYNNEDELMNLIETLLKDKDKLQEMMINNFHYYNNYLKPEVLVLNTLLKAYKMYA